MANAKQVNFKVIKNNRKRRKKNTYKKSENKKVKNYFKNGKALVRITFGYLMCFVIAV